ncbi:hypothetical protein GCM10010527_26950 [Streptomyces drozdowiczii]
MLGYGARTRRTGARRDQYVPGGEGAYAGGYPDLRGSYSVKSAQSGHRVAGYFRGSGVGICLRPTFAHVAAVRLHK